MVRPRVGIAAGIAIFVGVGLVVASREPTADRRLTTSTVAAPMATGQLDPSSSALESARLSRSEFRVAHPSEASSSWISNRSSQSLHHGNARSSFWGGLVGFVDHDPPRMANELYAPVVLQWFDATEEVFSQVLVREVVNGVQRVDISSEPKDQFADLESTFSLTDPIVDIVLDTAARKAAAFPANELPGTFVTASGNHLRMKLEMTSNSTARGVEPMISAELVSIDAVSTVGSSSVSLFTSTPTSVVTSAPTASSVSGR